MAVIVEEALKKDLSSGRLARGYLLFGNDAYLKQHYADRIGRLACDGDPFFNLQCYGNDCDLQEVYNAVLQFPVMADRKCVMLTDYDFAAKDKDVDRLCVILGELNDTCVFVLRFDGVAFDPKSSRGKRIITAFEKNGGKAVQLDHLSVDQLAAKLIAGAKKRGCGLEYAAARYLVETAGNDFFILQNELEKLCSYAPGKLIDRSTVDLVCTKTVEASIYDLTDRIIACNPSEALDVLDSLFFMRVEPNIILYTVSAAYVELYRMSAASKADIPTQKVAEDFGYRGREFVLKRAARNLRRIEPRHITLSFEALLDANRTLRSFGDQPRAILEQLVVKLCYILAKGESA